MADPFFYKNDSYQKYLTQQCYGAGIKKEKQTIVLNRRQRRKLKI